MFQEKIAFLYGKIKFYLLIALFIVLSFFVSVFFKAYFLQFYVVSQKSMLPVISPGDRVLVEKISVNTNKLIRILAIKYPFLFEGLEKINFLKIKDIIIFKHSGNEDIIIKRVTNIDGDEYFVEGDNSLHSVDSRVYGSIAEENIIGRVCWINHVYK